MDLTHQSNNEIFFKEIINEISICHEKGGKYCFLEQHWFLRIIKDYDLDENREIDDLQRILRYTFNENPIFDSFLDDGRLCVAWNRYLYDGKEVSMGSEESDKKEGFFKYMMRYFE